MKQRWLAGWFRIFALCLALGLGAAFVWSQQKNAAPVKSREAPAANFPPTTDEGTQGDDKAPLMPGSKSTTGIIQWEQRETKDPSRLPGWNQEQSLDRTLMHSSKSAIIVEPKDRVMMPGSKSLILPPQKAPQKTKP